MSSDPSEPRIQPPPAEGAFFTPPGGPASAVAAPTGSPRAVGFTIVSLASAVALLYYGRLFFITVIFALFLAFAMRPFVSLLERARVPRVLAILLLLFVLIGALVLLFINVTAQLNEFYGDLPRYQARIKELLSQLTDFVNTLRERMGNILPEEARGVREVKIAESPIEMTRTFVSQLGGVLHLVLYAAAVPFLTFFMLKDREKFPSMMSPPSSISCNKK